MNRIVIGLLFSFLLSTDLSGQISPVAPGTLCWNSGTNDGSANFAFTSYRTLDFHVDGYGNSYSAGYEMTQTTGSGDRTYGFVLSKFDEDGTLLWQKNHQWPSIYSTNDNFLSAYVTGIATDNNKNIYISGCFNSKRFKLDAFQYTYTTNANRAFIAQLDSNGVCQWVARITGSGTYHTASSLVCVNNRLYISQWGSGTMYLPDGSLVYPNIPSSVVVLDCFGNFVEDIPYTQQVNDITGMLFNVDQSGSFDHTNVPVNPRLQLAGNGDIYLMTRVENYANFGSIIPSISNASASMNLKTVCAQLDIVSGWENAFYVTATDKNYDGNWLERIEKKVVFSADSLGNVYYADHWEEIFSMPGEHENVCLANGDTLNGNQVSASCLLKFNSSGTLLWQTFYSDVTLSSLAACTNGVYAFGTFVDTLFLYSLNGDSMLVPNLPTVESALLCKTDNNGDLLWATTYGGGGCEIAYCLRKSPCSDNFYFTGLLSATSVTYNQNVSITVSQPNKVYVSKHSPGPPCVDPVCVMPDGISEWHSGGDFLISGFPNPASDQLSIVGLPDSEYQLQIYDATGKRMQNMVFVQNVDAAIPTKDLLDGIYFMTFTGTSSQYSVTVIVIH